MKCMELLRLNVFRCMYVCNWWPELSTHRMGLRAHMKVNVFFLPICNYNYCYKQETSCIFTLFLATLAIPRTGQATPCEDKQDRPHINSKFLAKNLDKALHNITICHFYGFQSSGMLRKTPKSLLAPSNSITESTKISLKLLVQFFDKGP